MRNDTNAAYDFSLFEPHTEEDQPSEEESPRHNARAQRGGRTIRPAQALRWTAGALIMVIALGAIMACNVQNTKLTDEVASMKTKLSAAQADEVRLDMQLQSRASLDNVQSYAVNKLGMQKTTTYQIQYIHLNNKDKVVLQSAKEGAFARIYDWIVEYL